MTTAPIDVTEDGLHKEIEASEKARDTVLRDYDAMVRQYAGEPHGIDDLTDSGHMPENLTYEWLSFIVPKLVMHNPRVSVYSRRQASGTVVKNLQVRLAEMALQGQIMPEEAGMILQSVRAKAYDAMAIEHGLNRWCRMEEYSKTLDRVCYDMLQAFGCLKSRLQPAYDDKELRWPKSDVVPPTRLIIDKEATHWTEALWMGDWRVQSKKKLLELAESDDADEKGWNKSAIGDLSETAVSSDSGLTRDEVRVYEIWVKDYFDTNWDLDRMNLREDEVHGGLFTIGTTKDESGTPRGQFIRKPRPHYGPRWGPYSMFGAYIRQNSPYPLSPLLATFGQQQELQRHMASMSRNAGQYKRIVIVSDKNPQLADDLKNKPDMFVVTVSDESFDKNQVVNIEIGGVADQQLKHFELFKGRWDRIAGMDDAQRGSVTGQGTATEHAIADDSSKVRLDYMESKFSAGVRQDLMTKAWYMAMDDRIKFRLGPEAGEAFGTLDPIYEGGIDKSDEFSFDDLEFEIDAYSMQRTGEALMQKRILEITELVFNLARAIVEMPHLDGRDMLNRIGDAYNMPNLGEVIDFDMVQMMAQQMQMAGMGQPQTMSTDGMNRQDQQRPAMAQAGMMGAMSGAARGAA